MVMNGGLTSTFPANNSQFPQPQQRPAQPAGSEAMPDLGTFKPASSPLSPPTQDSVSLTNPSPFPPSEPDTGLSKPKAAVPAALSTDSTPASPFANSLPATQPPLPNQFSLAAPTGGSNGFDTSTLSKPSQSFMPQLQQSNPQPASVPQTPATTPGLPAAANAAATNPSLPAGLNALSPAQQTGKQVGDIVTKLLEEVPALQEKIDHVDWEALSQEEVMPKLEKLRVSVQPTFKHVPTFVDRKLARLFEDPQTQKMAKQFFDWLRKEPDPETLASLNQAKARPHTGGGGSMDDGYGLDGPGPRRHRFEDSESGFEADDEASAPEKQSLIDKTRSRVQDSYASLKDKIAAHKPGGKPPIKAERPGHGMKDDDFGDSDMDLDSLLRHSRSPGSDMFSSGPRGHKPSRFEDDY